MTHKQPRQDLSLCGFSFARYWAKYFTQIHRALYGDAMLVPFRGAPTWRPHNNRNICHRVLLLKRKHISPEFRHIESNNSFSARTIQVART